MSKSSSSSVSKDMSLKSEIHDYLLENDFSLVDDVISSDTVFVYIHDIGQIIYKLELFSNPQNKFSTLNLETETSTGHIKWVKDFTLTCLDDLKLILSRSCGSPLLDTQLFD